MTIHVKLTEKLIYNIIIYLANDFSSNKNALIVLCVFKRTSVIALVHIFNRTFWNVCYVEPNDLHHSLVLFCRLEVITKLNRILSLLHQRLGVEYLVKDVFIAGSVAVN